MSLAQYLNKDGTFIIPKAEIQQLVVNEITQKGYEATQQPVNIQEVNNTIVNTTLDISNIQAEIAEIHTIKNNLTEMFNIISSVFRIQAPTGEDVSFKDGEIIATIPEVDAEYNLTQSQINFMNSQVFNSIGRTAVLDLGVVLTKCYRIDVVAKANVTNDAYINIILKNDENGSTLINTGFQKTYSTKSRNYGEMDVRYIRVQSYWNNGTIQSVKLYFKELQN